MKAVIQRVSEASLSIDNSEYSKIKQGLLVFIGFTDGDDETDIEWLAKKIINLRIFPDENQVMNLSVEAIEGEILLVSQFTLFASTKKGNRPSFTKAAHPDISIPLYQKTIDAFEKQLPTKIKTGKFGADMQINLINNGPVTIQIDSKNKI